MGSDDLAGVDFPAGPDGRRSTSAVGRAVVADALRAADPALAQRAEREANWRTGYLTHFRALVEAGLAAPDAAAAVAAGGLDSLYRQLRAVRADGTESGLDTLLTAAARRPLAWVPVSGTAAPQGSLAVPYRGTVLQGDALRQQLSAWVAAGTVEPSFATAVDEVARHPDWLRLEGWTAAVLGAGAEMGPASTLLGWGARVLAVDLPQPAIWERLLTAARDSAGTLLVPVAERAGIGTADGVGRDSGGDASLAQSAGADLVSDVASVADGLAAAAGGSLVLANYAYADGAGHVRVAAAVDALTRRVQAQRADVALAFLATPTDVFAVPADAVAQADRAYGARSPASRLAGGSLHVLSGGRLLQRAYQPGADPGINDSLVAQQGPNYALAKRLQRWRATVARRDGATVSINIAPLTRTRSVLKNRALAAAYAGAHRFGVEVFEPETSRVLMAALLVYDLHADGAAGPAAGRGEAGPAGGATAGSGARETHPWQDEAHAAAHAGLWRMAYAPRSALSLAAALGYLRSRK